MTLMDVGGDRGGERVSPVALALCGCLYWLLFLLMLEPDNLLRAWRVGHPLSFGHEALRITAATLLGAAATPIPLALTRRFPLLGDRLPRNLAIHIVGAALLAFVLVVLGCVGAAWGFEGEALPSPMEIRDELAANWTLLVFAVCGVTAVVQWLQLDRRLASEATPMAANPSARIPVRVGGRLLMIAPGEIDWIEGQGNYLALHVGPRTHLTRATLKALESRLEADRFARIHRGAIVAVDRIREMKPLTNGDAVVTLADGQELRVSRGHREALRRRWPGG